MRDLLQLSTLCEVHATSCRAWWAALLCPQRYAHMPAQAQGCWHRQHTPSRRLQGAQRRSRARTSSCSARARRLAARAAGASAAESTT